MRAEDVLYFWFTENGPKQWWQKSEAFDAIIRRKFIDTYELAILGGLSEWRETDRGRLAEIIVIDQFARNMFRDTPRAFIADPIALVLSQEAVLRGVGEGWSAEMKQFLYMPYMHSEEPKIHEEAVELFSAPGLEDNLDFELRHKVIVDRFGRYPHRNAILGRENTEEELEFLKQPGSRF
ncbi:DUF924 domain-containing protein [Kordiimonas sp. SCSIO 12603]|uniref:DUF924 family protein n=1 Tax=Kordiimonas sp. SCSIO 12603 TaxID=2829596 RepID=UPI0021028EAD|nr:DUF924 family protein [Kordiimonas sp. SCSIO 12603]UTW57281.1 DUF924 domain-containing protein [Kordiimonas sp. SCSIO 12603]